MHRACPQSLYTGACPLVTVELRFVRDASDDELANLARSILAQISEKGYDEGDLSAEVTGCVRWGITLAGKWAAVTVERVG